jgi:voltage-gated potassium channel
VGGKESRGGTESPSEGGPLVTSGLVASSVPIRVILLILVRAFLILGGTLLLYALAPIDGSAATAAITFTAAAGLVGVLYVFFRQFDRIERAERPGAAAIEALLNVAGLYLTLFAFIYVSLSASSADSFSQPLDKVAGVYFSVTILATVGFGDIAPKTDAAQVLVTLQMILNIILMGTAVKMLTLSAKHARSKRRLAAHPKPPIDKHRTDKE